MLACGTVESSTDAGLDAGSGGGGGSVTGGGTALGGGGAQGGGASLGGGSGATLAFCDSCVASADCGADSLCLGGVEPRCAKDCSATMTCGEGAACTRYALGKGGPLGTVCLASETPSCGAFVRRGDLSCTDNWANYGQNFFATVCTGVCHRHDTEWTTVTAVRATADSIRLYVETGSMPQAMTLSAAERRRLLTWLACGAP